MLYCFDREKGEIIVPDDYLDVRLSTGQKRELRAKLGIKDAKGHPIPYQQLYVRLHECGYTVECGRENNSYYIVIRKETE